MDTKKETKQQIIFDEDNGIFVVPESRMDEIDFKFEEMDDIFYPNLRENKDGSIGREWFTDMHYKAELDGNELELNFTAFACADSETNDFAETFDSWDIDRSGYMDKDGEVCDNTNFIVVDDNGNTIAERGGADDAIHGTKSNIEADYMERVQEVVSTLTLEIDLTDEKYQGMDIDDIDLENKEAWEKKQMATAIEEAGSETATVQQSDYVQK